MIQSQSSPHGPDDNNRDIAPDDLPQPDIGARPAMWGLGDMARAGILVLAIFALLVMASVGLYWAIASETGPLSPVWLIALVFAGEAIMIYPAWRFGPRRHGGGWSRLGLRRFETQGAIGLVVVGMLGIWISSGVWGLINARLGWQMQENILPEFGGGLSGLLVAMVLGAVVAPVAEEIFFRGFLYTGLRARWGKWAGLIITSLLFSLMHVLPGVLVPIFFMGLILGWLYERTGSIWPAVIVHGLNNALAFLVWYTTV